MSIYQDIGGAKAVKAAVDEFYVRVLADPDLVRFFEGRDLASLKASQREFIGAALGGPEIYQGDAMSQVHASLGVGNAQFDGVVGHLLAAFASAGVPAEAAGQIAAVLGPLRGEIVTAP
ncbi:MULTISPECIES: group I truncated hemoglobin [Frankia]|uniref:Group 1 truncated hemoglobin n=1 Tax=Frankia alni (strain DSM 45986 / CECT 9034 / ACN14a) TaxID=326424 RepID=Q0RMX2_FRAAA|nr:MULTISPECIES: group 1 truncated hemoglobin [Frankia]CAJ61124.1 Hemoglobin-like protein HbN (Flavohemoglobin) [Frankia alni ACN14a]